MERERAVEACNAPGNRRAWASVGWQGKGVVEIRRVRPDDGPLLRAGRIAAITDTPIAFSVTLAETMGRTPQEWDTRVRTTSEGNTEGMFLAVEDGQPVGIMGAYFDTEDDCWVLISVWIHPDHRGGALATELHTVVTDWVRGTGATEIFLDVGQSNDRAQAFYRGLGYVATGKSQPHPWHPTEVELDMRLTLRDG